MEEYLLAEEQVISKSQGGGVLLTNYKIRYALEKDQVTIIMLDQISGIRILRERRTWLLFLASLSVIASILFATGGVEGLYSVLSLIGAGAFILIYFASRNHVVTIASSSMSIVFETSGMSHDEVMTFVNQVEEARRNVIMKGLYKASPDASY